MSLASVGDVATRLGRPISEAAEVAQVEAWLDDIEEIIKARFIRTGLTLSAQMALDDPTTATVVRVEASAVVRRLQNPSGLTSVTRTIDDASITERRDGQADIGYWLDDDAWFDLLGSYYSSGAFSTQPGFDTDYADVTDWIPTTP